MAVTANDASKCPVKHTLDVIGGKWKARIIAHLQYGSMRTSELKRALGNITDKVLSDQLKELRCDGLILRHDFQQVPPKVEYRLTEKCKTLLPIINMMFDWGVDDMKSLGQLPMDWSKARYTSKLSGAAKKASQTEG